MTVIDLYGCREVADNAHTWQLIGLETENPTMLRVTPMRVAIRARE
jgi:hypothetical protein